MFCSSGRLSINVITMTSTPKSTNEDVLGGKSVTMFIIVQLQWVLLGRSFQLSLNSTKSS